MTVEFKDNGDGTFTVTETRRYGESKELIGTPLDGLVPVPVEFLKQAVRLLGSCEKQCIKDHDLSRVIIRHMKETYLQQSWHGYRAVFVGFNRDNDDD